MDEPEVDGGCMCPSNKDEDEGVDGDGCVPMTHGASTTSAIGPPNVFDPDLIFPSVDGPPINGLS